jgi:hypothetical protein
MPEVHHGEIRHTLTDEGRAERQVIVLKPDNRWLSSTLLSDHGSEGSIDVLIVVPMARLKDGPFQLEVTQGPEGTIGKAIVKASHLRLAEPDASQGVLRVIGWHLHVILRINSISICTVVAPRYPGTMTSLHDRIERRGEAARRPSPTDGRVILKQVRSLRSRRMAYSYTLQASWARGCECTSRSGSESLAVPAVAVGFTV